MKIFKELRKKSPQLYLSIQGLGKKKKVLPKGRARLYIGEIGTNKSQTLQLTWLMLRKATFAGISLTFNAVDGCNGIGFFAGVPYLLNLWFTIHKVPEWMLPGYMIDSPLRPGEQFRMPEEREIGIRVFDKAIWISLWNNQMEWNSSDPWWWQFTIWPLDILLGRTKYNTKTIMTGRCVVPMPEHEFQADYKVFESTWKRPRWPCPKRMLRIEIKNDEPIPLPGKGTTSYNCDDDASYSVTMPLLGSIADAVKEYAGDIVRDRVKRCGREIYP